MPATHRVTVVPEQLHLVDFDRAEISRIVGEVAHAVGLPPALDVAVELDETTPMGRAAIRSLEPVVIEVESGAFEDAKRPRQLSPRSVADVAGRLLLRVRDRLDPAFGEPPPEPELTLLQSTAWDAYCMGRMARLGHDSQEPRRRFHFRVRHGFTDAADRAFDALWHGVDLTWSDVERLSLAATDPAPIT